jgi:hypothetical protein
MPFAYTSGNPDNLTAGGPARMQDIQGPFYDLRAYLNSAAGSGGGSGGVASALAAAPVLDVGMVGQVRAGHQLANADFTALGLSVPTALWNLGDLTDISGNGRALINKGGVGFVSGINGIATTAAQFTGSTGQALYVADTGAADPLRIKTGSWGCWFRTAKRGTYQSMLGKFGPSAGSYAWLLQVTSANTVQLVISSDGTTTGSLAGVSDVIDDRWHFVVMTHDSTVDRIYVDGVLEAASGWGSPLANVAAPLNIGGNGGDASTAAGNPFFGRIDEAFVTADVLSDDQVRCLYAAKVAHGLGLTPRDVTVNVNRRRKGTTLTVGDFPTQPLRLHNFTSGSGFYADEGSNGQALAWQGGVTFDGCAGADGRTATGLTVTAGSMGATDAGLPAGTTSRSYGCWFKVAGVTTFMGVMGWGTTSTADARVTLTSAGLVRHASGADFFDGPFVADGQWHFFAAVEDNAAGDGVRRKLYLDGRLVGGSTVLNAIGGAGAQPRFRIGAAPDGTLLFTGQIDGAFVTGYALTFEQVAALYAKGSQALGASPKNAGDHIERMDATSLYLVTDTLESQHTLDVSVTA